MTPDNNNDTTLFNWEEAKATLTKFMPLMVEDQIHTAQSDIVNPLPEDKRQALMDIPFQEGPR